MRLLIVTSFAVVAVSACAHQSNDASAARAALAESLAAPPDVAQAPAEATKTASGLAYRVLQPGTGTERPGADSKVTIHFTGWTTEGKRFDSSVARGHAVTYRLGAVIAGWAEVLQLMTEGEKVRVWIPEALAFNGKPGKPKGTVVYDVELLRLASGSLPPPEDVSAAPTDGEKTPSGLVSRVLQAGAGTLHPGPKSVVQVQYTGWTTDGKMFDTSVGSGEDVQFGLDGVIPGWTEGVQLMVEGEKRRFWIPEALAYKGKQGAPQGMLVFDVELLQIVHQ